MMSSRERSIAWVAGLVISAVALERVVITPLLDRQSVAQARLDVASDDLAHADRLFQAQNRLQKEEREMAGDTLQSDPPSAESQLLNHAREWAQQAGLSLTSLKPERTEREEGFGKITVRASATGDMQSLARFLYQTQGAEIPVRVVDVTASSRREGTDELTVQIGLATIYLLPEEPGAQPRREVRQ